MKLKLKKDIVIPKGTVFENIDGTTSHHYRDLWSNIVALSNDTCAELIVSSENKKYFEIIK